MPAAAASPWRDKPEDHDYGAAEDYLSLVLPQATAKRVASHLASAPRIERKAKDLLRASGLALLPADDRHVMSDLAKIHPGSCSPPSCRYAAGPLPVSRSSSPTVTTGSALFGTSGEDAVVQCRIVDLPKAR